MTGGPAVLRLALGALLAAAPSLPSGAQELHGHLEADAQVFLGRRGPRDPRSRGAGTAFLEARARRGRAAFRASLRGEILPASERAARGLDLADRALRRGPVALREAYLRVGLGGGIDLQAGRFLLGWGKTDGYSPADAFLPRDLTDPFADEKLPLWGARLLGTRGSLRYELLASAPLTPWRLPVLEGRYAPVPAPAAFLVDGTGGPPRGGFAALRVLVNRGPWDLGLWARGGNRPAPLLVTRPDLARPAPDGVEVPADRRWVEERGAGIEVSRVAGPWVLRGELGALHSGDPALGGALLATAGIERGIAGGILIATLAANTRTTPGDVRLLLDRAFLPGIVSGYTRDQDWGSLHLAWSLGLEHGDGLLKGEVRYNLTDRWSAGAGTDLPYGASEGPFGALGRARRVRAGLRRSW